MLPEKGRKEVSELQMSLELGKQFDPAKQKEIMNYVVNDVLEKQEPHERTPRESRLRMRWILEYRLDDNEIKSPKARIVMLAHQDPDNENRPAASPTMTRNLKVTVAIRIMDGILCIQVRRQWSVPARPQTPTSSLDTTSSRTGGCSESGSRRNHEVAEGSLRTGGSAREMVHQHIYSTGGARTAPSEIDGC